MVNIQSTRMGISDLIEAAGKYQKIRAERLQKAYDFANKAHSGQTRMSGEAYITHPLSVAMILTDYQADEDSLVAALLHDVVEDTKYGIDEVEKMFGKTVAKMVSALTKLPHSGAHGHSQYRQFDSKIESLRKIFEVMQEDVRVIVIKLCDRLHNMRTLKHFRAEKQQRIAQETLDVYTKIADRLCLGDLHQKLVELSFQYLYPNSFQELQKRLKTLDAKYQKTMRSILRKLKKASVILEPEEGDMVIVPPYQRLVLHHGDDSNAEFQIRVSVRVKTLEDAYLALKEIHSEWRSVRGAIRDYLIIPKSNGYQALETSAIQPDGSVVIFIIQTPEMVEYARYGVATRSFSKSHAGKKIELPWVENLKTIHKQTKDKSWDYMSALESDILKGSIVVYTVDNRTLFLPPKSTALDAAFFHLGDKAYRINEILVDQQPVLFSHHLQEGDRIHFNLSSKEQVKFSWLRYVQTAYAKSYIFEKLKHFSADKKEEIAEEMLQNGLDEMGYGYLDEISNVRKEEVAQKLRDKDWKEVLQDVAEGSVASQAVLAMLFEKEEDARKSYEAEILIKRTNGDESIQRIFSHLKENGVPFTHLSTKKYDHFYIDRLKVKWSTSKKNSVYSYFKEFLHFHITELKSIQRGVIPYLYLMSIPLLWSLNTFISRYVMQQGLSPENTTELRFVSAAVILFILATLQRIRSHEKHSSFHISFLFFFISGVLCVYSYLINLSLFHTESINYIIPASMSFVLVALVHAYKPILTSLKNFTTAVKLGSALGLCFLSGFFLFQQDLSESQSYGVLIGFAVLVLHMVYNYFGNVYQQKYKIKSRGMMLLAYSFAFASLIFLPFVDFSNLQSVPESLLLIAVVNGVFTGGIAHFFFFETSKYLQHFKLTIAMSFMIIATFAIGALIEGSANWASGLSSLFVILALLMAARFEYHKQGVYDTIKHLV